MLINNLGQIVPAIGERSGAEDTLVSILSVCNCLGRLACGAVGDIALARYQIPRPVVFGWFILLMVLAMGGNAGYCRSLARACAVFLSMCARAFVCAWICAWAYDKAGLAAVVGGIHLLLPPPLICDLQGSSPSHTRLHSTPRRQSAALVMVQLTELPYDVNFSRITAAVNLCLLQPTRVCRVCCLQPPIYSELFGLKNFGAICEHQSRHSSFLRRSPSIQPIGRRVCTCRYSGGSRGGSWVVIDGHNALRQDLHVRGSLTVPYTLAKRRLELERE